jgi:hypothetical protein
MNYEGMIKLSNFIGSKIIEVDDGDGHKEWCLAIPMDRNGLVETKNHNVYCKVFINEQAYDTGRGNTHYLRQKTNDSHRKQLESLGYDTPYLGTMRPSNHKLAYQEKYRFRYNQKVKNIEEG